jgi:hypothetical protein
VLPERLGVAHDRVGTKVPEPGRIGGRVGVWGAVRRGEAGAALVQHEDPVVLQRALQPRRRPGEPSGPRRLLARASLEEDQQRPVMAVVRGDLTGEHLDRRAAGVVVIEREVEPVIGDDNASDLAPRAVAWVGGHAPTLPAPAEQERHGLLHTPLVPRCRTFAVTTVSGHLLAQRVDSVALTTCATGAGAIVLGPFLAVAAVKREPVLT